jgi:hypothetical protein
MKINYRILKKKALDILADLLLPKASGEDLKNITDLRSGISELPSLEKSSILSETEWNLNRIKLRKNILKKDPRNFLRWPVVDYTMFHESKVEELQFIKGLPNWKQYENALKETRIGHPKLYPALPVSSGNLIHHAYSWAIFAEAFKVDIGNIKQIFEFGGGYGSMARFLYQFGFKGNYIIFDLPEFSLLQKYFLSSIKDLHLNFDDSFTPSVLLTGSLRDSAVAIQQKPLDVFIALWSLSESPVELRDQVAEALPKSNYYLIAYQERFNSIDNVSYFKEFSINRPDYNWLDFPIPHLKGHRYLIGKNKTNE